MTVPTGNRTPSIVTDSFRRRATAGTGVYIRIDSLRKREVKCNLGISSLKNYKRYSTTLTLLHSERPKPHRVLAVLRAIELILHLNGCNSDMTIYQ